MQLKNGIHSVGNGQAFLIQIIGSTVSSNYGQKRAIEPLAFRTRLDVLYCSDHEDF